MAGLGMQDRTSKQARKRALQDILRQTHKRRSGQSDDEDSALTVIIGKGKGQSALSGDKKAQKKRDEIMSDTDSALDKLRSQNFTSEAGTSRKKKKSKKGKY